MLSSPFSGIFNGDRQPLLLTEVRISKLSADITDTRSHVNCCGPSTPVMKKVGRCLAEWGKFTVLRIYSHQPTG
jgi:hypothetical protein